MVWFDLGCLGWVVLLHSGWCVGCILLFDAGLCLALCKCCWGLRARLRCVLFCCIMDCIWLIVLLLIAGYKMFTCSVWLFWDYHCCLVVVLWVWDLVVLDLMLTSCF